MSASRALPFLLILILILPPGTAQTPPPASGDWTVTDETTIIDQTVTLSGNLTIRGGGVLTLHNVTLIMNCTVDGQYGIKVASDGALRMNRSIITSSKSELCYNFSIYGNASIENSTIEKVWGNNTGENVGGVEVFSDEVILSNSTVRSSDDHGGGIKIDNSSPIINGCEIYDCEWGIIVVNNSNPQIKNNHIHNCYCGIYNDNASAALIEYNIISDNEGSGISNQNSSEPAIINNIIARNELLGIGNGKLSEPIIINNSIILNGGHGIQNIDSTKPLIENNTIDWNGMCGIINVQSSELIIINNSISNNTEGGIQNMDLSNGSIKNNIIIGNGWEGITNCDSSNTKIINNSIIDNKKNGISNIQFSKSLIEKNNISRNGCNGIVNEHSSDTTICNNSIINNTWRGIFNGNFSKAFIENNMINENGKDGIVDLDFIQTVINNNTLARNGWCGIENIDSSKSIIYSNSIINNKEKGIYNTDFSNASIENNTINCNNGGVSNAFSSEPIIIKNSIMNNTAHGIQNLDFSKAMIENNTINGNLWCGIANFNSSEPTIVNNSIINNTEGGIQNGDFSKASIEHNTIKGNGWDGILGWGETSPFISNNSILNSSDNGIECYGKANMEIVNNVIAGNMMRGISARENSRLHVYGNNIHNNNDYGIGCEDNSTIIANDNKIVDNRFGAWLSSGNTDLSRNDISGGEWGIKILGCSPALSDNSVSNTNYGIELFHSDAQITNTTISSISKYSIYCIESSSPLIINSTIDAGSEGWAFSVNGDSHPIALNSVFDKKLVKVEDNSSLTIKWFMHLYAKDSKGRPLDQANIMFEGTGQVRAATDDNGSACWLTLEDRTIYKGTESKASYHLSIEKYSDTNTYEDIMINKTEKRDFIFDFAPLVEEIPEQSVLEDSPFSLNLSSFISDRDHDLSELQISLAPESSEDQNVSLEGTILKLFYSLPMGMDIIRLNVSDGLRTTAFSVTVHVSSRNDPPVIRDIPPLQLSEDIPFTLDLSQYITDEEDALRFLTIIINSPYAQIEGFNVTFCYPDGILNDTVEISVQDMNGASTTFPRLINLAPVNDPPVIEAIPEIHPVEDIELVIDLSKLISDSDTPLGNISIATNSSYCKVDRLKLKFLYPEGVLRDSIRIIISDGQNSTPYDLLIAVKPVNDPPILTSIPSINVIAGKSHTIDLWPLINDSDTSKEKISIFTTSPHISISGFNVTISYPADKPSGNEVISLRLSDQIDITTVNLPVNVTASKVKQVWTTLYSPIIYILVPLAIIGTIAGILVYRRVRYGWYEVKRAMIVNDDGRMIAHFGAPDEASDDMIVSSMFTAVQQFIEEAMKKDKAGSIKEFQYEDMKIAIERGQKLYLAVFLKGYAAEGLRKQMREMVSDIEARYLNEIAQWDGRMTGTPFISDALDGLRKLAEK
jgi:parallel beta-helix repeat protein